MMKTALFVAAALIIAAGAQAKTGAPDRHAKFSNTVFAPGKTKVKETENVSHFKGTAKGLSLVETLSLHDRVKVTCAFVYAMHEHEAYVTQGDNGPRVDVTSIVLHSNIGGDRKDKTCTNSSGCARTEKEVNLGCRKSCVSATATQSGFGEWSVGEVCQ